MYPPPPSPRSNMLRPSLPQGGGFSGMAMDPSVSGGMAPGRAPGMAPGLAPDGIPRGPQRGAHRRAREAAMLAQKQAIQGFTGPRPM